MQRLPSVAAGSWVHGTWHEAVIGTSGNAAVAVPGRPALLISGDGFDSLLSYVPKVDVVHPLMKPGLF